MQVSVARERTSAGATPRWLWLGLVLALGAWVIAWFGPPPLRYHTFFPLWLGYILVVDGLTSM